MRKNQATYTTTLALYTSFADVSAWMGRLEAIDQHHVVAPGVYERYKSAAGAKAYHTTMSPAGALGRDRDLGTLEPGKLADLVILDADPLTDIRNIVKVSRVIKGGNLYEPAQLIDAAR